MRRKYLLHISLILTLLVVTGTELLSIFHAVSFKGLSIYWMIIILLFFGYLFVFRKNAVKYGIAVCKELLQNIFTKKILLFTTIALLLSLIVAIAYPPNNFDSMTYHMARVAHWQQNESIAHYRTHIIRQIEFPPLAEWMILQLQILTGGDRFANAVQLIYFILSVVTVTVIVSELGGNRRQQIFSAVIACFIPMAIIQSNTTQNDIVLSFYVSCFAYFTLRLLKAVSWPDVFFCGLSLGFSWLTKGTGYLFTLLFCGWFVVILVRSLSGSLSSVLKRIMLLAMIPIIAVCVNIGHYQRNIFYSGTPLGNAGEGTVIEGHEIKQIALITVKNLMNHLPVNSSMKNGLIAVAARLGVDINDVRYNFADLNLMISGISFHEDYAQNLLHVVLIGILLIIYFLRKSTYRKTSGSYLFFVLTLLGSTFLFCALLQWQPWANRLETPLFILFSAFVGIEIEKLKPLWQKIIIVPIIIYGFVAIALNARHPILPFSQSVFSKSYSSFIYPDRFEEMGHYIDNRPIRKIGIYIGSDSWDYPFYKLLSRSSSRIIQHVFVQNNTTIYVERFLPDAVISQEHSVPSYTIGPKTYYKTETFGDYVVFEARN